MQQLSLLDYLHLLSQLIRSEYVIASHDFGHYEISLGLDLGQDSPVYVIPKHSGSFKPVVCDAPLIWAKMQGMK